MKKSTLSLTLCIAAFAQQPRAAFDVTSVKPHIVTPGERPSGPTCAAGQFFSSGPVARIVFWAYNLAPFQIAELNRHLPDWTQIGSQAYDVQAASGRPVTESECREMAKSLLADRFQFAVRWESREGPVYELTVARGGPKLEQATDGQGVNIRVNGQPVPYPDRAGLTMPELAEALSARLNPPAKVIDKTGLAGLYKIGLAFSPPPQLVAPGTQGKAVPRARAVSEDPNLFAALQQQLGLRLDERKGVNDYLIADRIEKPDPN